MTETAIPQAASAQQPTDESLSLGFSVTPLAAMLAQGAAPPLLMRYRGVETPEKLDALERETAALAFGVAVNDLGWLRRVEVRGEDRFRWLSGMITNTVNELGTDAGAWNLVLNAQGRIQGDLHVWREGDSLDLEIAADQYEKLLAHLDRFIIMDDVELAPKSLDSDGALTGETALGLAGPLSDDLLRKVGVPVLKEPLTSMRCDWGGAEVRVVRGYGVLVPHYELWVRAAEIPALWKTLVEAGAAPVGATALEAFRIAEGIPVYGIDIAERDLAQETSQMRALSFSKGCYLGQEIVERIRSRGNVHRHLRLLEVFGPVPTAGAELTLEGGAVAGQITSAAELPLPKGNRVFALGMIRGEAESHERPLNYTAGGIAGTTHILGAPSALEAS